MRTTIALAGLLLVAPAPAVAQSIGDAPPARSVATIEMLHPTFVDDDHLSALSGAWYLGAAIPVRTGMSLMLELPYVRTSQTAFGETVTSSSFGNPYIGGAMDNGRLRFEAGLRLPLASDEENAVVYGIFSDFRRWEAFAPNAASVRASVAYTATSGPASLILAGGPIAVFDTDSEDRAESEVLLDYSGHVVYAQSSLRLSGGVVGRGILTESLDFSQRTDHQALLAASYAIGRVRPGIHARIPLDEDMREVTKGSFGVFLQVDLNR